jgi:hypothetical protein
MHPVRTGIGEYDNLLIIKPNVDAETRYLINVFLMGDMWIEGKITNASYRLIPCLFA